MSSSSLLRIALVLSFIPWSTPLEVSAQAENQEVIIRIRDRGHVNKSLKMLRFGDVPTPRSGTKLHDEDSDKVVGFITSAVQSPKFGEVIGLAYVRRGCEVVTLHGQGVMVPQE